MREHIGEARFKDPGGDRGPRHRWRVWLWRRRECGGAGGNGKHKHRYDTCEPTWEEEIGSPISWLLHEVGDEGLLKAENSRTGVKT